MKIAFVSLPLAGHLNPILALAARVQSFGHEVVFISLLDAEERTVAAGLRFVPVGREQFPLGSKHEAEKGFSVTSGESGMKYTSGLLGMILGVIIRPLEELLAAESLDGVVFDAYQFYLELTAISLGLPYVHISNSVPFDVSGETPLCFFNWEYSDSAEARKRNLEGVEIFRTMIEPSVAVAKDYAREKGLTVDWTDLTATRSKLAWITQLPPAFDFGSAVANDAPFHAGPFIDSKLRPSLAFPWERLTEAPLVYASMGTLQNGIESTFHHIINAARGLEDLQFVVVLGNKLDSAAFEPLPKNVILVANAPQLELLKRASLCVTHAGLNTVLEALSEGVPLVALPVTHDQPGAAARIRYKRVGDFLELSDISAESLRNLIVTVLSNSDYR